MNLIDIGCNLTHDSFDEDREAVIQRARDADVNRMVVTGAHSNTAHPYRGEVRQFPLSD